MVQNWVDLKKIFSPDKPSLLLGNGFSINLYSKFQYGSLYEQALKLDLLKESDKNLFESLETTNFEYVLRIIKHAELYLESYGINRVREPDVAPSEVYKRIREALIKVVTDVHCQWNDDYCIKLNKINNILDNYSSIFTTNYDLLIYWSVMALKEASPSFKDFFWNSELRFNLSDSHLSRNAIPIFYLHGSLFIYHDRYGYAYKRRKDDRNLLEVIREPANNEESPLLVAEGEASKKHSTIGSSDYLEFCFNKLNNLESNLVIFGHSLNKDHDGHIIDILKRIIENRKIAISIHNPELNLEKNHTEIERYKQNLGVAKDTSNLFFFYAHTHPLGNPELALDKKTSSF